MRPLARSYGVISTSTLSPASTRMRFLRMRPAVCAMISCSFSSLTRKVAFGSSSVTTPGNSKSSSFAIRYLEIANLRPPPLPTNPRPKLARNLADDAPFDNCRARQLARPSLFVAGPLSGKAFADVRQKLVADGAVSLEPLLATAFGNARIGCRPIFHIDPVGARDLERPVVGLGSERHDEIEIEPLQIIELLEGQRLVARDVEADFRHNGDS